VALVTLTSCAPSKPFDTDKWKLGDAKSRGDMVPGLVKRKTLIGKGQAGVQDLLGKPNFCGVTIDEGKAVQPLECGDSREDWYAYEVTTTFYPSGTRYFCLCKLEITFGKVSKSVESVLVR
jgi:hypothetical protein